MWLYPCTASSTPIISRIECMDSCGDPTSTVLIPERAESIGPIVLPQPESLFTCNDQTVTRITRITRITRFAWKDQSITRITRITCTNHTTIAEK